MKGFYRAGISVWVAVVMVASGLSLVACSAPAVIDPGKDKRDRQEMEQREKKSTQELDRALKKTEPEQVDDERSH